MKFLLSNSQAPPLAIPNFHDKMDNSPHRLLRRSLGEDLQAVGLIHSSRGQRPR
jgi:hypothetical protein